MKWRTAAIVGIALAFVAFAWLVRQLSFGSMGMAANREVRTQLRASLDDQKKLSRLDPEQRDAYRARFASIERLLGHLGVLEHSRAKLTRQIEIALLTAFVGAAPGCADGGRVRRPRRSRAAAPGAREPCNNSVLAGSTTVRFSLRRDAAGVHLDVADDGAGVDPAIRGRLFEPYTTTRPVGEGMGLGLAISKKILLDHGGDLTLLDNVRGATFRLTFAATEAAA